MTQININNGSEWEILDPLFDESAFPNYFDKQFRKHVVWKLLICRYPNTCLQHYHKWRNKIGLQKIPTPVDIGVFHWQILHNSLPKI
jgi:hypothetical protein